jgi:hypothetical protein
MGCGDGSGSCGFLHSSHFAPPPEVIRDAAGALIVAATAILPPSSPYSQGM